MKASENIPTNQSPQPNSQSAPATGKQLKFLIRPLPGETTEAFAARAVQLAYETGLLKKKPTD